MERDRWGHDQPSPERPASGRLSDGGSDSDSEYEEITTTTRTVKKTTYNPKPLVEALRSKEMGANKKLFGKDLSEYDNMDMDDMLDQLTAEEIDLLTRDVDPDDSLMPPDQRTSYRCDKSATGPLNRKKLIDHINEQSMTEPDRPEEVPYEAGVIRGKKWVPPPPPEQQQRADDEIALNMGDEYESALADATESEMVDLAAILGFHSMMNQDQYHASLLGKKLDTEEVGWSGITRASQPKPMAPEPPNTTDTEQSIERIRRDDPELRRLNLNNIQTISDEQFGRLCEAARGNTRLEGLLVSNTCMGDTYAEKLVELIESNPNIKEISIESNFVSPPMIARLVKALLVHKSVETFRAANQRPQVLGNKIEMEITKYVEQNHNLLQLGLHFDFNDARARVSSQLAKNRDRLRELRHHKQPGSAELQDTTDLATQESMSNDYSIQLPATDSLPARSGGIPVSKADDQLDGLADDVRRNADDLAARAVRAAADVTVGMAKVTGDAQQVAQDVTTVARDVDRVAEDVERAVTDVQKTVADVVQAVGDFEKTAAQVERDFLDGGGH